MIDFAGSFDVIAVPVLIVESGGRIVFANQKAVSRFGVDLTGGDVCRLFTNGSKAGKLLANAQVANNECSARLIGVGDGSVEYRATAAAIPPGPGAPVQHVVLTFEDQTPLRVARSMRSDFVANVSHEVRSPLTAISSIVETLQDDAQMDSETRTHFLGMMDREVARMTNLVSDLLSLSKVEVKERRVLKKTQDMAPVLMQAKESLVTRDSGREPRISVTIAEDLPQVLGKFDDLLRVFINLFENALNYSRENGQVTVTASFVGRNGPLEGDAICVAVKDEGEGIPAEEIPRLTERFYRVDKSRSRNMGGTGLGLAIVKHILVRHRGKLVIESIIGQGSTFRVYLPVHSDG